MQRGVSVGATDSYQFHSGALLSMLFQYTRSEVRRQFNLGVPLYYCLLGRKLFGKTIKYPRMRFGHFPAWLLRDRLYLNFGKGAIPPYRVPERVETPQHRMSSWLAISRT